MDSFKGSGHIEINPGSSKIPIWLRFPPASGSTKNDGAAPYGSTILSYSVSAWSMETNSSSTALIDSKSHSSYSVQVFLTYTTALDEGMYYLRATIVHDLAGTATNMTKSYDLDRIMLKRK